MDVASVVTLGSASSSLPELELEPEPELLDPEPEPDELELEPESEDFFGFALAAAWASLLLAVLTTSGRGYKKAKICLKLMNRQPLPEKATKNSSLLLISP